MDPSGEVFTELRSSRRFARRTIAWIAIAILFEQPLAFARQSASVPQQLQELKQQYDQVLQELQRRIAALEQQIKDEQVKQQQIEQQQTAAASQKETSRPVGAQFQGQVPSRPTYELLQEAGAAIEQLQQQASAFEFHGYFRSGYGVNSEGGQQVPFQAPGAGAKYRLGNETETYGEFILVNNWLNPERAKDKAWFKTQAMIEANTSNSASFANFANGVGNDQYRLREAFVQGGHLVERQPNARFWAGERYYRRQHIEINDFYPLDMSGYGGGVEDLDLGFGKLAAAYLAGARPDIATENGTYIKSNVDVRVYDLKAPAGTFAGWVNVATSTGGTTSTGGAIPDSTGYAVGMRYQRLNWHGGFQTLGIQYGTGAASNFTTSVDDPAATLDDTKRLLVTGQLLFQPNETFAVMPIAVYQRTQDGVDDHGWDEWISFGARPEVFFTRFLSLAIEGGVDHTRSRTGQYDGWLRKVTIAPQIGTGRQFFSRPVLRTFMTYGNWTDGLRGFVGGTPFKNRKNGLTFGVQAETWW